MSGHIAIVDREGRVVWRMGPDYRQTPALEAPGQITRVLEIDPQTFEIVWEYVSPYFSESQPTRNHMFRAHRVPYDWVPQIDPPRERGVSAPVASA